MQVAAIVPAFEAERTVGGVVESLRRLWPDAKAEGAVTVVDDGSRDGTAQRAKEAGALVVSHGRNKGKGAAIQTGLRVARDLGFDAVVTVDADGQHPAEEAVRIARFPCDERALVLGVRDLRKAGAPRANRISNEISNFFLSVFTRRVLADTQCGLRRYSIVDSLAMDPRDSGYAFEAEVLLLAARYGMAIVEVPVRVIYDQPVRVTHFNSVRDPARIVARVLYTLGRQPPGLLRVSDPEHGRIGI